VSKRHIEVSLSQVGVNDDSGILQKWFVTDSQFVNIGDIICEFETTKTVIEIEAENEGYILPIVAKSAEVASGDIIAIIVGNKKDIEEAKSIYLNPKNDNTNNINNGYRFTKKAKELIDQHKIDIESLSFKKGIIRTKDILSMVEKPEVPPVDKELSINIKPQSIIIYGAGKGAVTLYEAINEKSTYNVACFVDDSKLLQKSLLDIPVFHRSELKTLIKKGIKFIACEIMGGKTRLKIKEKVEKFGYELINVIHPKSYISKSVKMGNGNYIKSSAVIETNTTIGNCCIIDNGSIIAHDNNIGDGCHIAPGASLGSSIHIGDYTVVGIGASISTGVNIGKNCIISVGSTVMKDVPDNSIVEGVPGKIIGTVKK